MATLTRRPSATPNAGEVLRECCERRRNSQLHLSIQADISAKHLSFVEPGPARPT